MANLKEILHAVRCLERLGGEPGRPAASALEIARQECLPLAEVEQALDRLCEAGLVRAHGTRGFALTRPPSEIRVGDVWSALGARGAASGRLTIADLLHWESRAFSSESVARAA